MSKRYKRSKMVPLFIILLFLLFLNQSTISFYGKITPIILFVDIIAILIILIILSARKVSKVYKKVYKSVKKSKLLAIIKGIYKKIKAIKDKHALSKSTAYYNQRKGTRNTADLDSLPDGYAFESFVAEILIANQFQNVTVTQSSGDYGVDVLAEKEQISYAIQCKYYDSPVGVKAVQEVSSGKTYYHAHIGIVATNNIFTKQAHELADKTGIILWGRDVMENMLSVMTSL